MAQHNATSIRLGRCGQQAVVQLSGPCTAAACDRLRHGLSDIHPPDYTDLSVDLSKADWIDSTFAGYLVSFARHKDQAHCPTLHLIHPSEKARYALEMMHLLPLFDVRDNPPVQPESWEDVESAETEALYFQDLIIDSHQALIDADRRNASTFDKVVEFFRDKQADA